MPLYHNNIKYINIIRVRFNTSTRIKYYMIQQYYNHFRSYMRTNFEITASV